jgi:M6 family metalloprotease-like protein
MKNNLKILGIFSLLVLTSCAEFLDDAISELNNTSASSSSISLSSNNLNTIGYYKPNSYSIDPLDYKLQADSFSMPSKGDSKLLVIPVNFTDYSCSGSVCVTEREKISQAFFGEDQTMSGGWHSVKSYYYESSYGQLDINGTVTPWFNYNRTVEQAANRNPSGSYSSYYDPTWDILDEAISWIKTSQTAINLKDYDTDNDGFIDAIYMIYYAPHYQDMSIELSEKAADMLWAYRYWNYRHYDNADINNPKPISYAWSSRTFMNGFYNNKVDAHTYIHEMGHILGLDDYYTYSDNDYNALGGTDMMDFNIGDHNAYSKFFLGWTDPYVINNNHSSFNQSFSIELNPFESSGEHILIKDNWNGSVFDEYISIEFYTPTGLNYKDSLGYYDSSMPSVSGIKIKHVDSRLGVYNLSNDFLRYTDTLVTTDTSYSLIAASNSKDYSQNSKHKLISLINSNGQNIFKEGYYANNDSLFKDGDSFSMSSHSNFFNNSKFNRGDSFNYKITITSITDQKAILLIERI